jgi:hypothetical protein
MPLLLLRYDEQAVAGERRLIVYAPEGAGDGNF